MESERGGEMAHEAEEFRATGALGYNKPEAQRKTQEGARAYRIALGHSWTGGGDEFSIHNFPTATQRRIRVHPNKVQGVATKIRTMV